jgi:hypothetical protein
LNKYSIATLISGLSALGIVLGSTEIATPLFWGR